MLRNRLLGLPKRHKRVLQVLADVLLVWLCLWLAFVLRVGFAEAAQRVQMHSWLFVAAPLITIPVCIRLGMYRAVMRFLDREALLQIAKAVTLAAVLLALAVYWVERPTGPHVPRSFVALYWIISLLAIGGLRVLMRQYFLGKGWRGGLAFLQRDNGLPRVAIYGAGSAGNQLARALRMGRTMQPVAFLDDDDNIATRTIAGLKVYKPKHIEEMLRVTGATQVLLAMPSASRARRSEILALLEPYPVHVRTVPGFMDLASGRVKVQDLQEVDIADLLGREAVTPDPALFGRCINNRVVMVTGAGGSIGSELCRQILASGATTLILYEHSEFNLYQIHAELEQRVRNEQLAIRLLPILGSIRNRKRLVEVMRTWQVETLYHAAAYKHVPMVEHNTSEGILNNVMGTLYTAQAAIVCGVQNFVLISTDKAVRPTNVMGSSKRLAEMVLQALSAETDVELLGDGFGVSRARNTTRFTMVRFGNVLGSSGSVIPLFRRQIREGGPLTVTHPEITRYFMTIPEASQLVIQAGSMGQGGDVFVLDMGEPVRIVDLAEKMVNLSGLTVRSPASPAGEIAIEFTGLRPGEKLYEELLIGDNVQATSHPMIMSAHEDCLPWAELRSVLMQLKACIDAGNTQGIRQLLLERVSGYNPQCGIVDLLHGQPDVAATTQTAD